MSWGPQYFREKYNCDPSNLKETYFATRIEDEDDFT